MQPFQQTGLVADRRRPARSRVTNPRTDRFITLTHLRRRFQTATSSARQYGISKQIVLRRLRQARQPLRPRSPYVGQVLTARHRAARLQWEQLHFCWGRQQWARVLLSDESRFNLSNYDGGMRVFRRRVERFADNCLIERDRFGGGSVMVWGGIIGWRKTNLIVVQGNLNAQGYINQILQPEAVPFLQRHGPAILIHDNARPHVARICQQFLNRNNVNVLPWPAVSPDMNPIEHIWDYLGRKIRARGNVHNLRDLEFKNEITFPTSLSDVTEGQCEVALLLASIVEVATLDTDYSTHRISNLSRMKWWIVEIANFIEVLQLSFSHLVHSRDKNIS